MRQREAATSTLVRGVVRGGVSGAGRGETIHQGVVRGGYIVSMAQMSQREATSSDGRCGEGRGKGWV